MTTVPTAGAIGSNGVAGPEALAVLVSSPTSVAVTVQSTAPVKARAGVTVTSVLIDSTPMAGTDGGVADYWRRRRSRDPDLWVIELDVAGAEQLVAETLLAV